MQNVKEEIVLLCIKILKICIIIKEFKEIVSLCKKSIKDQDTALHPSLRFFPLINLARRRRQKEKMFIENAVNVQFGRKNVKFFSLLIQNNTKLPFSPQIYPNIFRNLL